MKRTLTLCFLLFGSCLWTAAENPSSGLQEFRGIILNETCYLRQPTWIPYAHEHALSCAMQPQCYLSGYYLVVSDDKVIRLDKRGELLARGILQTTQRQNNFRVRVRGRLQEGVLFVQSMEEAEP